MHRTNRATAIIGLTGGAGSGKSTVAAVFKRLGACVVDADRIGHQLLEKGSPCYARIIRAFGPEILSAKGEINRARLGNKAFSDQTAMAVLNAIIHPELIGRIIKEVQACRVRSRGRPVVVDAALIVQWGMDKEFDLLIMVDSLRRHRLERLAGRGISKEKASGILDSQMPASAIKRKANIVITNNGTIEGLEKRAARAWKKITKKGVSVKKGLN